MSKDKDVNEIEPWEFKGLPAASPDAAGSSNPESIVRKSFRHPIEKETVYAEIDDRMYKIVDITSHGLGMVVSHPAAFSAGMRCDLRLHLPEGRLNMRGEITHTSSSNKSGEYRCGVMLLDMNPHNEQKLQQFLDAHHARLFGKE